MRTCPGLRDNVRSIALSEPREYFRELLLGPPDESEEQHAARLMAAHDVFAELLDADQKDDFALQDALYVARLSVAALLQADRPTVEQARTGSVS